MAFLLTDHQVDRQIRVCRYMIWLGLALGYLASQFDGLGILTAFMTVWLGACGGTFAAWRTERGLWMLAGVFLLLGSSLYGIFQYMTLKDLFQGKPTSWLMGLDASLGTTLLLIQIRLLLTIAIRNWPINPQDSED